MDQQANTDQKQPVTTAPAQQATEPRPAQDPGHMLGIVGLIFAFLMPLVGLVLSLIAKSKSSKAGFNNSVAKIGLILSIVFIVVNIPLTVWTVSKITQSSDDSDTELCELVNSSSETTRSLAGGLSEDLESNECD